jgi:hypothetical protein
METPLLYRQLQDQLRQWVCPVDQRHLHVFCEILVAILQSGSGVLGKWIPYLAHRNCQARAHLERFSYFLHNQQITAERFYQPMLRPILSALDGEAVLLSLDTSMLWDKFCLKSTNPAASGRGMKRDLLPNLKLRIAVCPLRRRASGNLPLLD